VDNDSTEVTSSGRSFHVRGPTTGKARLVGDGCQPYRRSYRWSIATIRLSCTVV